MWKWLLILFIPGILFAGQKTVIELWDQVKAPAAPVLQNVEINSANTALLILDVEQRTTNGRPRAFGIVPAVAKLLKAAREHKVLVVYSNTPVGKRETILPEVKPLPEEPIVSSSADKYYKTDLEKILSSHSITRVIIVGISAEGAVLNTSTQSAIRKISVIVPVDGIASAELYAEQYVLWHLMNAPALKGMVTLTTTERISFK